MSGGRGALALALGASLAIHAALLLLLRPVGGAPAAPRPDEALTLVPFGVAGPSAAAGGAVPAPRLPVRPPAGAQAPAPGPAGPPARALDAAAAPAPAAGGAEAPAPPSAEAPREAAVAAGGAAGGGAAAGPAAGGAGPEASRGAPDGVAGAGPGPSEAEARLLAAVHARLLRAADRCAPAAVRRRGVTGVVQVRFRVSAGGGVEAVQVLSPSASPQLDEAATGCVVPSAAPFPAEAAGRSFDVPVRF